MKSIIQWQADGKFRRYLDNSWPEGTTYLCGDAIFEGVGFLASRAGDSNSRDVCEIVIFHESVVLVYLKSGKNLFYNQLQLNNSFFKIVDT